MQLGVEDRLAQVCLQAMNLAVELSDNMKVDVSLATKSELNKYVDKTCMYLIDKLGDNQQRVRERAEETALAMAKHQAIGGELWIA